MLDTHTLVYFIKNKPPSVAVRIDAILDNDLLCMSFVTFAELLKGAEGSTRKSEVLRPLEEIAQLVPVLYPDGPGICVHYAAHATRLRAAGTPLGGNDLWIASHALAESATLVTNDMGEFGRITGLDHWAGA